MHTHFGASPKKIFEKIYPFTCSNWEVQNYRVFLKNFLSGKKPSHLFGIERSKRTLFFRKKAKNFFEKTICLKNIPSLVPTGRGQMHPLNGKIFPNEKPPHSFGQRGPKCTPIFGLSSKNFLRKFIPSLVPTGGVHLGTVVSKKGKKCARQHRQAHFR